MCSTSNSFAVLEFNDDFDFMLYGFKSTNANQYSPVGVIRKRSCTVCSSPYKSTLHSGPFLDRHI